MCISQQLRRPYRMKIQKQITCLLPSPPYPGHAPIPARTRNWCGPRTQPSETVVSEPEMESQRCRLLRVGPGARGCTWSRSLKKKKTSGHTTHWAPTIYQALFEAPKENRGWTRPHTYGLYRIAVRTTQVGIRKLGSMNVRRYGYF